MKKEKENKSIEIGRLFEIILYNEDGPDYFNHLCLLEELCINNNYSYYYITHDKDKDTKVHTHYLIYTNGSTTTLEHISKECDIPKNKIEKKNFLNSSIKYLTHESTNSKDKELYNWQDINTNDITRVNKIFESLDENTTIRELISYIEKSKKIIELNDFVHFVLDKGLWSYYRRSASIMKSLIEEHNNKIQKTW